MTDNVDFHWFGDICIRADDIQAFTAVPSGTNVFLITGTLVVSSLDAQAFAAELTNATLR